MTTPTKTNQRSTAAVINNLSKSTGMHREAWESLSSATVEEFTADAKRYLRDQSNLKTKTIDSADWSAVHAEFYPSGAESSQNLSETAPAGAMVGYARVSTRDQDPQFQINALKTAGAIKIFGDTASGKSTDGRAELAACLEYLRAGDVLVCWKLDRVARSVVDLINLVDALAARGIGFKVLTGALSGIDTTTADGRLFLTIIGGMAEFERSLIVERTLSGLDAARAEGRIGGRPRAVDADTHAALRARRERGESVAKAAKALGISRATAYRALG
jgi:DNA invertase Pin-like site-specific DNA recombinase